ncbi:pyridoxamine 5'-phosphate oxidase family protein [Clostridiaceae bacterium M8S5]|nr:pyridoxamine 5'-phosphate oxidase family protein [Clostridiaceae bacterium M8S5]
MVDSINHTGHTGRPLNECQIKRILTDGVYGTMATVGEDQWTYAVPLNYVYYDDCIYFHSGTEGKKIEHMNHNNQVSFNVVTDERMIEDKFNMQFRSATVTGKVCEVEGAEAKLMFVQMFRKYTPHYIDEGMKRLDKCLKYTKVFKIEIEKMTGKANI